MRHRSDSTRLFLPVALVVFGACLAARPAPAAEEAGGAAEATQSPSIEPPLSKWETRVHTALRRESSTTGAPQDQAVRDLVSLYESLERAKGIDKDQRAELRGLLRNRLARSSQRISKRLEKSGKPPAAESVAAMSQAVGTAPGGGAATSASGGGATAAPGGGQGGQQMPPDYGLELVELIQHTIAPKTWEINGGNGTIMYFAPRHAIVVRQTDDVHGDLGNLLGDLQK